MNGQKQTNLFSAEKEPLTTRQSNIIRSPKQNGTEKEDSKPYLDELGIEIIDNPQPIQFFKNSNDFIHRWSPYVQGFSAKFVQSIINKYKFEYREPVIFDPFAGSGTVLVQAKLNNYKVYGVELNPLLYYIANTKLNTWHINPDKLKKISNSLEPKRKFVAPEFLKSKKHFNLNVLRKLETIKSGIDSFTPADEDEQKIKDLMLVAFSAILIDCSNLKRTPCLGYTKNKTVEDDAPFSFFKMKINEIAKDLEKLQSHFQHINEESIVYLANSKSFEHTQKYDVVITSPPYMNGLDYVINYKIEMGWLGFAENHTQLKIVKDDMVVCDNVSKGLIKKFAVNNSRYTNSWLKEIKRNIKL
ncbi:MAG: DNA methyltransferase, partial [bacterium]|nr:DNA methyltransferase [bacterium]